MITKEDEMVLSEIATGDDPGKDYDYRFTGTANWDACLNFWLGISQVKALQAALAQANDALKAAKQQPVAIPQATLDQINQTSTDVSWIKALLTKIFK